MKYNTIGFIGAMDDEIEGLKNKLEDVSKMTRASMEFCKGRIGNRTVVAVKSGVGKVNAAICAQILVDEYKVEAIINTGAAGSLENKINIGDIVIGETAIQHDMDSVDFGFPLGQVPFMPLEYKGDAELADALEKSCKSIYPDLNIFRGLIVSGDEFVAKKERKDWIKSHFDALCTEMEGAAIAQCAYLNNIPFLILRAISDKADDSASMDFPEFAKMASGRNIDIIMDMLS